MFSGVSNVDQRASTANETIRRSVAVSDYQPAVMKEPPQTAKGSMRYKPGIRNNYKSVSLSMQKPSP